MKVLIADTFEKSGIEGLEAAGCDVVYEPELKDETLRAAIGSTGADVLIVRGTTAPPHSVAPAAHRVAARR